MELRSDVSAYSIALDNSNNLQKTRDSLVDAYRSIKTEDKDRLTHFLPSTIGNIELILEIEKIANLYGLPLKDIKFEVKSPENKEVVVPAENLVITENNPTDYLPYNIFPMEFMIEGRYETFIEFLKEIEDNLRLVDIKNVSFKVPPPTVSVSDTIDPGIYSYTLKIQTYWLK
jgi:Tfp pilus assembly protein PilO